MQLERQCLKITLVPSFSHRQNGALFCSMQTEQEHEHEHVPAAAAALLVVQTRFLRDHII